MAGGGGHLAFWSLSPVSCVLVCVVRNGEMQVLSRWNMAQQKLTVSRVQCAVRVAASGAPWP